MGKETIVVTSNLAPDLTVGQQMRLQKACREADRAYAKSLKKTRNVAEAFIVWRRIAEKGLPERVRQAK